MKAFEFRPSTSAPQVPDAEDLVWGGRNAIVVSDLDPWLTSFGPVPDRAIDLVRLATGAFVADQRKRRPPTTFTRSFDLRVHLQDPSAWSDEMVDTFADLLSSLTGDKWNLEILQDTSPNRLVPAEDLALNPASRVALLSGGLDSFAGAVLSRSTEGMLYLGHWSQPAVKEAQNYLKSWFAINGHPIDYEQVLLRLAKDTKIERTTRSRSLLFMALAVALATARGAHTVEVPENGHTSINPPLGPERGGALSTRSTHPRTIARFNSVLVALGIDVAVENPHAYRTKGELVALAATAAIGDFATAAANTFSCAKPSNWYLGGNANSHCGLCVACVVRRGSLIAAGVPDLATYLCDTLTGEGLESLLSDRSKDVAAVKMAVQAGLEDIDLWALGPYPDDFDLDRALDTCRRGLDEMAHVPLG